MERAKRAERPRPDQWRMSTMETGESFSYTTQGSKEYVHWALTDCELEVHGWLKKWTWSENGEPYYWYEQSKKAGGGYPMWHPAAEEPAIGEVQE